MIGKFNPVPVDGESSICNRCTKMYLEVDRCTLDVPGDGVYVENYLYCTHKDACQMLYKNYIQKDQENK